MKLIETTYQKFYEMAKTDKRQFYVKDSKGQFTPIKAVGKKIANTWVLEFDNGYMIKCADKHAFMNQKNEPVFAEDLKPNDIVRTVNGVLHVKSRHTHELNRDVYDITVDDPHWYTNDEVGLIHHNTMYSLICAKAYLDKYEDAVLMFYDSEMGAGARYFESLGIDPARVLHIPITDVEQLKFDMMAQLEEIKRGDHVIIVVDSIGNLASKKEVDDTLNEKSSVDMTRAKQLKSLTRMITPHLNLKNIPVIMIGHTYIDISSLYASPQLSGGTGLFYSSNQILYVSRSNSKKGTDLVGYNFNLNVMKGRLVREKARIPITVLFNGGLNVWSGLLDMAVASGDVIKPSNGWYQVANPETGEVEEKKYRAVDTNTREFWDPILKRPHFKKWIENTFSVSSHKLISDDTSPEENQVNQEFTVQEE